MSSSKKKQRKDKKQKGLSLFPPDAILGIMGGSFLSYLILVGHPFNHPWHWAYSAIGGLVGYIFVLFWAHRPSQMRPQRGRRPWLSYGGAGLMTALFIVAFVLIGYVFPADITEDTTTVLPPTSFSPGHAETYPPQQVNTKPIPLPVQEHIMEHVDSAGPGIIVSYNCQDYQCEPDLVERLANLVQSYPPQVFLAPFPDMDVKIALTTQGKLMMLDTFDEQRIRKFIDENLS